MNQVDTVGPENPDDQGAAASGFDFGEIDQVIHVPARLGMLAYLSTANTAGFRELQHRLGLTDGNLAAHLRKLETAGYVTVSKTGAGRASSTSISLTPQGRSAFRRYLGTMTRLVESASPD